MAKHTKCAKNKVGLKVMEHVLFIAHRLVCPFFNQGQDWYSNLSFVLHISEFGICFLHIQTLLKLLIVSQISF